MCTCGSMQETSQLLHGSELRVVTVTEAASEQQAHPLAPSMCSKLQLTLLARAAPCGSCSASYT
jgi:hypothetical protein